jgi:hypothetical protein
MHPRHLFLTLLPFCSLSAQEKVNGTLTGKVMCGYHGWFSAQGGGMGIGWQHYTRHGHQTDVATVDLWPDVSELDKDEIHDSPLRMPDGRPAPVFSSANPKTVHRHFDWMRTHGIDGVFLQRFGSAIRSDKHRAFTDRVMENVRTASAKTGRSWSLRWNERRKS